MCPPTPILFGVGTPQPSMKDYVLKMYEEEHATTMRVLRAYPEDQLDLRPHPTSRSARELGWTFALEGMLAAMVFRDEFADRLGEPMPEAPTEWADILAMVESSHSDFLRLVRETRDADLLKPVRFFTAPKTLGQTTRLDWMWFLLHDSIHHRGQFSVYLRMAGGKVPSIYGPTADESWA